MSELGNAVARALVQHRRAAAVHGWISPCSDGSELRGMRCCRHATTAVTWLQSFRAIRVFLREHWRHRAAAAISIGMAKQLLDERNGVASQVFGRNNVGGGGAKRGEPDFTHAS